MTLFVNLLLQLKGVDFKDLEESSLDTLYVDNDEYIIFFLFISIHLKTEISMNSFQDDKC